MKTIFGGFKILALVTFSGTLMSCASMLEHRTFTQEMQRESDGLFVPGRDFRVVPGDSGQAYRSQEEILMRTPASYRSKDQMLERRSLMTELQQREASLSEMERREYARVRDNLHTESERIYYLSLSPQERRSYIEARNYGAPSTGRQIAAVNSQFYRDSGIYSQADLALGMSKAEVSRSWGQPNRVEVAGNPRLENERWVFIEGRSVKYVYFERGRVNGWILD
jgi:hypothetical protein